MSFVYITMLVPACLTIFLLYLLVHSLFSRMSGRRERITQAGIASGFVSGTLFCTYWFSTVLPENASREISVLAQLGVGLAVVGLIFCFLGRGYHSLPAGIIAFLSIFGWLYSIFAVCCHD